MKSVIPLILVLTLGVYAGETAPLPLSGWKESFDSFNGTHASLPSGVSVSKDASGTMGSDDADFRGVNDGNVTAGGCYAWETSRNDHALGYQPTSDEFTPGWFQVTLSNTSEKAYQFLKVSYEAVILNNADRSSKIEVEAILPGGNALPMAGMTYSSDQERDTSPLWIRTRLTSCIRLPSELLPGQKIILRWRADDNGGSGSRDEIGIDNILVMGILTRGTVIAIR